VNQSIDIAGYRIRFVTNSNSPIRQARELKSSKANQQYRRDRKLIASLSTEERQLYDLKLRDQRRRERKYAENVFHHLYGNKMLPEDKGLIFP
jgi:hypothetical protein